MARKTMQTWPVIAGLMTTIALSAAAQSGDAPQDAKARKAAVLKAELFLAILHNSPAEVNTALAQGADPSGRNWLGLTPLMWAASNGNLKIADTLLDHHAELDAPGTYGTALSLALVGRQEAMALHLLDRGAGVRSERVDGATPLMLAAGNGEVNVIKALITAKDSINAVDGDGETPLIYAARTGKAEAVTLLLQTGADVKIADSHGRTPLMYAAENGYAACVDRLLAAKADCNVSDKVGATALTLAARHSGNVAVMHSLIHAGARTDVKEAGGATALVLAEQRDYHAAAKLLNGSSAAASAAPSADIAIARSLTAIQTSMKTFAGQAPCVSCHHQGLGMMALGVAQQRGFAVQKDLVGSYLKQMGEDGQRSAPVVHLALMDKDVAKTIPTVDIGETSVGAGYILGGMIANGVPSNPGLQEMSQFLTMQQMPDGHWGFGTHREPMQSNNVTATALVAQVLHAYGVPGQTSEALTRAKSWLLATPAPDTETKATRLLGLSWAGGSDKEREKPLRELLAAQRPDGGWAIDTASAGSDAYATGMALYALHVGGELSTSAPAYQKGVRFLLKTQDEDGSWYLNKRCNPGNTYFDAGFPNGVSQYASFAASCWAVMALMQSDNAAQQAVVQK